jgi:hypothetical protein
MEYEAGAERVAAHTKRLSGMQTAKRINCGTEGTKLRKLQNNALGPSPLPENGEQNTPKDSQIWSSVITTDSVLENTDACSWNKIASAPYVELINLLDAGIGFMSITATPPMQSEGYYATTVI